MRNKLIVLLILGVTALAGVSSYIGRGWAVKALEAGPFAAVIKAEALPLHGDDPALKQVGALSYVAGWALTSESDHFGGFSGMVLGADGKSIVAINDKGDWLEARLDLTAKNPLSGGLLYPVQDSSGMLDKANFDAESLIRSEGGYLVSFEQNHRIQKVTTVGGVGKPTLYNQHADLSVLSSNSGVEAMARLPGGALLLFGERGLDQQNTLPVWVARKDGAEMRRFEPPQNYSPTDAATLPNGDVLLLMRHYSQLDGVSAKLMHLSASEIAGEGVLRGKEIAHLADPLVVDNMEALDIQVQDDGSIRLFVLSDDNFSPLQRTLLLVFDWKP